MKKHRYSDGSIGVPGRNSIEAEETTNDCNHLILELLYLINDGKGFNF